MKIGLLGGTFDPVHNGHLALAGTAYNELDLDRIIFIPAYIPPHKDPSKITPLEHRLTMLRLAVDPYPFCEISDIEISKERKVYTIETLREFHSRYPEDTSFYYLVGSDFIENYTTWKEYKELLRLAIFTVAARPGFSVSRVPDGIHILEGDFPLISSTDIRIIVRNGENVSRYVPSEVYNYIRDNSLYQT